MMASNCATDEQVKIFQMKKLIKTLNAAHGNGTSMISLVIPPKEQLSRTMHMLQDEYGTATNIKSRVNRQSVLDAITAAQQQLKLYSKCPPNGLIIYCGTCLTDEGKEKRISFSFEPFMAINTSLYLCSNKFQTDVLSSLIQDNDKYGFIIMDGNGVLYGILSGNRREVLHKFSVDLPKKHGRGGQSAMRFGRIRLEKRQNFVRKAAEMAIQIFISNDKPNITHLVLAGAANFKNELNDSDIFDKRLRSIVVKIIDVSYGGENGFNQAINNASDTFADIKIVHEKKLIHKYMEEIATDSGKYCFGIQDTMVALELGAMETLIVWEDLLYERYILRNTRTGEESYKVILPKNETNNFIDETTGDTLEVLHKQLLVEWFADNYQAFGTDIKFITDRSQEGSQFCQGFGGIGGILRWQVAFSETNMCDISDDSDDELFM